MLSIKKRGNFKKMALKENKSRSASLRRARAIHDPDMLDLEVLAFVCERWLKNACEFGGLEDMSNRAAADTKKKR